MPPAKLWIDQPARTWQHGIGSGNLPRVVNIRDCHLIDLPCVSDDRGALTFLEQGAHLPFAPVRVFYIHGVPAGTHRAGHALRDCQQVLVALAGALVVEVWDGGESRVIHLSDPNRGLLIPAMIWRELREFSAGSVCLVLASRVYDPDGYLRTKETYLQARHHG